MRYQTPSKFSGREVWVDGFAAVAVGAGDAGAGFESAGGGVAGVVRRWFWRAHGLVRELGRRCCGFCPKKEVGEHGDRDDAGGQQHNGEDGTSAMFLAVFNPDRFGTSVLLSAGLFLGWPGSFGLGFACCVPPVFAKAVVRRKIVADRKIRSLVGLVRGKLPKAYREAVLRPTGAIVGSRLELSRLVGCHYELDVRVSALWLILMFSTVRLAR